MWSERLPENRSHGDSTQGGTRVFGSDRRCDGAATRAVQSHNRKEPMLQKPRNPKAAGIAYLLFACCCGCFNERSTTSVPLPRPVNTTGHPLTVRMMGNEFQWDIQYPGPDGAFDTMDDVRTHQHLHLPSDSPITIELRSQDFVYSLYLPHIERLELACPGQNFTLEFHSGAPATHELLGTQMCGFAHPNLIGDLVVHRLHDFDEWQNAVP